MYGIICNIRQAIYCSIFENYLLFLLNTFYLCSVFKTPTAIPLLWLTTRQEKRKIEHDHTINRGLFFCFEYFHDYYQNHITKWWWSPEEADPRFKKNLVWFKQQETWMWCSKNLVKWLLDNGFWLLVFFTHSLPQSIYV